ncbi:DMT family transporter [Roseovarius spongiae]|nr:DMT family transporter [Roseovarius spongiae]
MALAATAILSLTDNFVYAVSQEAGLWQFQVFRALIALPLLLLAARLSNRSIRPVRPRYVALRSMTVAGGLLIYFGCLGALPVAQASGGLFSAPLWVLLLSAALLGVRIRPIQAIAIVAGFAGALLLLRPDVGNLTLLSVMPLGAGLFYGMGVLMTRHLCANERAMTLAFGIFLTMGTIGAVMLGVTTVLPGAEARTDFITQGWVTPTPRFLLLTALQSGGAVIAVTLIANAYRIGTSSFVAVFEYAFLIFASLWAMLLWGDSTDALGWTGIGIIVASGIAMSVSERRRARRVAGTGPLDTH